MFDDYHETIILTCEERLQRKLDDKEIAGIKNIRSFLRLESVELDIIHGTSEQIEEVLKHFSIKNK